MNFKDGSPLTGHDVFTWDPVAQTFKVQTSDYDKYYQDRVHEFTVTAYYETFPYDSGDSKDFLVELVLDCDIIPYEKPVFDEFTYVIDQMDPVMDVQLPPTYCGPWGVNTASISYQKDLGWCTWCVWLNAGLFDFDTVTWTINLDVGGSNDVG